MSNIVNVDFITKVIEIEVNDKQEESLAALAAINSAAAAAESAAEAANSASAADTVATALTDIYNDAIEQGVITAPAIDTTLSVSGAAADAKVVGDTTLRQKLSSYLSNNTDLDTLKETGYYFLMNTYTYANAPLSGKGGMLEVFKLNSSYVLQRFTSYALTPAVVYERRYNTTNGWGDWNQVLTDLTKCMREVLTNALAENTDLDTLTNTGFYFLMNSYVYGNHPTGTNGGLLEVFKLSSTYVVQRYMSYTLSPNVIYERRKNSNGWGDWNETTTDLTRVMKFVSGGVANNTDLNTLTDTGFYYLVNTYTYNNHPLPSKGGMLETYVLGSYIIQKYVSTTSGVNPSKSFVRMRFSGTWNDWHEVDNTPKKSIKILQIGSSFGQDQCTYAPFILQNICPEIEVTFGIAYRGATSFDDYLDRLVNDTADIQYDVCGPNSTSWTIQSNQTLKSILTAEKWDIITFNQAMALQEDASSYANFGAYIDAIVDYVSTDHTGYTGHSVKLGYLFPQVKASTETADSYGNLITNVQNLDNMYPLQTIIPAGTAIQNARGTTLDQYGDSGHMTADGSHLQEGIGCMVGAYTVALKVLELAGVNNISILGENTRPDLQWVTDKNIPGKNPSSSITVVGISDANCLIAQKCAIMAIKKPYEVSTIV